MTEESMREIIFKGLLDCLKQLSFSVSEKEIHEKTVNFITKRWWESQGFGQASHPYLGTETRPHDWTRH